MTKTTRTLIIIIFIVAILVFGYFWYMNLRNTSGEGDGSGQSNSQGGFWPFGRGTVVPNQDQTSTSTENDDIDLPPTPVSIPKLRQLSEFPTGGFYATSTASSTTLVRFIDRGTGHIYEATSDDIVIKKISNTTLPMVVDSIWSKNGNAFVARYIDGDEITNFYTELRPLATSTDNIKFELRGRSVWPGGRDIVSSKNRDQIFVWYGENTPQSRGRGVVGPLNEESSSEIWNIPATEFNFDWVNDTTITATTKGTAYGSGVMYSLNPRTRELKKIISSTRGLSGVMSKDGTNVFASRTRNASIEANFVKTSDGTAEESVFRTLAEKCTWSTLRPNEIYCAVPTEIPQGEYPDAWYKGDVSFVDQIWHLDRETGEVHLLSNPIRDGGVAIDAIDLTLDPKENTLLFTNKKDLTLWALDLTK